MALITGGDSGIGRAVAVLYAREGADSAIIYLSVEQGDAEEAKRAVEKEGRRCLLLPGDVTQPAFCREAVERTVKELGKLDILVNNAAYQEEQERLEDISDEQFDKTVRTNLYGYFYMTRAAPRYLPEGGVVVNSGSITGLQGHKNLMDYAATKGAIHAFTKSLAQNLVGHRVPLHPSHCFWSGRPNQLQLLGVLPDPVDGSRTRRSLPRGRLLRPPSVGAGGYLLREEEVPWSGVRLTRVPCRSRSVDGSTHVWIERHRAAGSGEGLSGLRFDIAEPV